MGVCTEAADLHPGPLAGTRHPVGHSTDPTDSALAAWGGGPQDGAAFDRATGVGRQPGRAGNRAGRPTRSGAGAATGSGPQGWGRCSLVMTGLRIIMMSRSETARAAGWSKARLAEGVQGVARFHALVAEHVVDPTEVVVATETDRGLFVGSLVAAGYEVICRQSDVGGPLSRAPLHLGRKSDLGDAAVLAELARTDRHHHRRIAGDSDLAESVKVLARAHQSLVWSRQRQVNQLRSTFREYYPAALQLGELYGPDTLGVLAAAPTPSLGRTLSRKRIAAAIERAGRQRRIEDRAIEIQALLRGEQLERAELVSGAMGASVTALVAVIAELNTQIARLEEQLSEGFDRHPDAKIVRSLPGLGTVLGARVLG